MFVLHFFMGFCNVGRVSNRSWFAWCCFEYCSWHTCKFYHLSCLASPIFYKYNPVKVCMHTSLSLNSAYTWLLLIHRFLFTLLFMPYDVSWLIIVISAVYMIFQCTSVLICCFFPFHLACTCRWCFCMHVQWPKFSFH